MRPTRPDSIRTRLGRAAALLAGVALLGACTTQPGIAGRSGDVVVTDEEVTTATVEYNEALARFAVANGGARPEGQSFPAYQAARSLLEQKVTAPVFAEAGATVTDAELDAVLGEIGLTGPEGGFSAPTRDLLRYALQMEGAAALDPAVQAELSAGIDEAMADSEFVISPRYSADDQGNILLPTWVSTQWRDAQAAG